jgi:hypothetical protein
MYGVVFYLIMIALIRTMRRIRSTTAHGLCGECRFAHIQYGANARRVTSCTFGGGVRAVKLDVLYCTDFCNRTEIIKVRLIGFVRENAAAEVTADAG